MENIFIGVLVCLRMRLRGIHVLTAAGLGLVFSDYASLPPTSLATGSLLTSTFDERAASARWFFLCALLFLTGCLFLSLTQKFSNFTRLCFSV